jgi:high-affinity iron transporter
VLSSFILSLREGLEITLIIGIMLGMLRRMQRKDLSTPVWLGIAAAVILSVGVAVVLNRLGFELHDPAEAIFEGLTMLLAAVLLTWMIFWMGRRAGSLKGEMESGMQRASSAGKTSLFAMAFIAVLREGIELALFLAAAAFTSVSGQVVWGALLGLAVSILLGWLLFSSTMKVNLQLFFRLTGFLLLLFAAGLVGRGVGELVEVGWLPAIIEHAWDLGRWLSADSIPGQLLAALFGYSPDPSLAQVLAYLTYLGAVLAALLRGSSTRPISSIPPSQA